MEENKKPNKFISIKDGVHSELNQLKYQLKMKTLSDVIKFLLENNDNQNPLPLEMGNTKKHYKKHYRKKNGIRYLYKEEWDKEVLYYDEKGEVHRNDGPAYISPWCLEWYNHGWKTAIQDSSGFHSF